MSEDVIQPSDNDRLLSAFRKLVRAEFPQLSFLGLWEYAVEATDGTTVDCSPTDTAIPLPSLAKVPMLAMFGAMAAPIIGKRCVIIFLNGDPTKARCVFVDGATEHLMTTEATALLIYNVFTQLCLNPPNTGPAGPWTASGLQPFISAAIVAALTAQAAGGPPGLPAQILAQATAVTAMAAGTALSTGTGPLAAPITSAVTAPKTPDVSGFFPGIGATQ